MANPVVFTEEDGRIVGKPMQNKVVNEDLGQQTRTVIMKVKGSSNIKAIIVSEDNEYYYFRKASNPNGSIMKMEKKRVKEILKN